MPIKTKNTPIQNIVGTVKVIHKPVAISKAKYPSPSRFCYQSHVLSVFTRGYTLIELMVTVALAGILVGAVTPSMTSFYKRNKVSSIVNNHSAALQLARHTAVSENVFVVVCPTLDWLECDADWQNNKMVFIDKNADGELNADEEIIGSADLERDYLIRSSRDSLRFAPFNTAGNNNATITICPDEESAAFGRALVISNVGRIRIEKEAEEINCSNEAE